MRIGVSIIFSVSLLVAVSSGAQQTQFSASQVSAQTRPDSGSITLEDAIARARSNEPAFAAAVAADKVAMLNRSLSRSALLPSVVYHNEYLYTQAAHGPSQLANASTAATTSIPRFIGNNSVHEYTSQGVVTETIGVQQLTAVAQASAMASVASAEMEIARRGLVVTVVGLYYGALAADHKMVVAQRAFDEANSFTELTKHRESAREAARADVVKAQLQQQQRARELADAKLQSDKARLDLAVLLFPDPNSPYKLVDFASPAPLATREELEAVAGQNNAELKSALASMHAASLDVTAARAAYLPDLGLNFNYGIDAPEFAVHGPDGTRNLGYSATVTLDIPVWDWFATHDRIKQKTAMRESAKVTLTATQRRLIAQLDDFYAEASVSRDQLQSLDQSAATARESLRLVRMRYGAGEGTVLEVVDAQNSLVVAESAREDGILRYQTALANLQLLTGTM
jgi:outer membrane protein TolC